MKVNELTKLISAGREIEFLYGNKKFSITYGSVNGEDVISFCEFYKESTEVRTVDELLDVYRYDHSVKEMLSQISDDDIWIF
ncbi:MAG: hypothetical protein NC120_02120 [Ruminococcus sp.]|nr:hypothetical protein [Ruminococcus sp.]